MSTSFRSDIRPLFRNRDLICMASFGVKLGDYAYMSNPDSDATHADHANARHVLGHLTGDETPRMPPGEPWSDENIELFRQWLSEDCPP